MNNQPFWMAPFEGMKFAIAPENWTTQDFIREIGTWSRIPILLAQPGEQTYLTKLKTFYSRHSQWLEYYFVEMPASQREKLRIKLHFSDCVTQKPYADFSLALQSLCRQVYGKSELLSQVPSYEHLLFLVEYSNCLQKTNFSGLLTGFPAQSRNGKANSKDDVINANHESILFYKRALIDNYLETQEIPSNQNWREEFFNILIAESVNTAIRNRDRDLKQHCWQFLTAFHDFNTTADGKNFVLWHLVNGKLIKSLSGDKPIALPSTKVNGIIGRPRGSLNKKKRNL